MDEDDLNLWRSRIKENQIADSKSEKFEKAPRIFHTRIENMRYTIKEKLLKSRKTIFTLTTINNPP